MRTYTYARQSVDLAEGIARQQERTRALCAAKEWPIAAEFTDNAVSASQRRADGTGWAELLASLEPGDVVVAVDVDRLLRSLEDLVELQRLGARVLTVNGEIDTTTADGEFRAAMLASIARFETRRKTERQLRANDSRTQQGKPVPGRRRYGYEPDNMTPRAAEAAVVQRLFAEVAAGRSLRSVARGLNEDGLTPGTGSAGTWSTRRLRDTLTNPAYVGLIRHRGVTLPSEHVTALVSEDEWERVQAILTAEGRRTTPGPTAVNLLSGLVHCTLCDTKTLKRMGTAYACAEQHNSILARTLEPLARKVVFMVATAYALPADEGAATTATLARLNAALDAADAESAQVLADRQENLLTGAVAREALLSLRDRRESLEQELREQREITGDLLTWAEEARRLFDTGSPEAAAAVFDGLDLEAQRSVIRGTVELRVRPGRDPWRVEFRERGALGWRRARLENTGELAWEALRTTAV